MAITNGYLTRNELKAALAIGTADTADDDLLDEIDEALEANAEEFVRNYVQKGGQ